MLVISIFLFIIGLNSQEVSFKIIFIGLAAILLFASALFTAVILSQTTAEYNQIVEGFSTFLMILKILVGVFVLGLIIAALIFSWNLWQVKRGFK